MDEDASTLMLIIKSDCSTTQSTTRIAKLHRIVSSTGREGKGRERIRARGTRKRPRFQPRSHPECLVLDRLSRQSDAHCKSEATTKARRM